MKKYVYINNEVTQNRCCYLFLYQQRKLHGFFWSSKYTEITNSHQTSDYIIIISCVVAWKFKKKTIELITKYSKLYPNKTIICYGCFSHLENETEKIKLKLQNIDFVNNDNTDKFNTIFPYDDLEKFSEVHEDSDASFENNFDEKKWRITIWHWCIWNCYYCNHKLTKKLKSKPIGIIKYEVKKRLSEWVDHFRFIGDDVWSYWYDLDKWINFKTLFYELMKEEDTFTFSLWPIYPKVLLENMTEIIVLLESQRVTEIFVAIEHISPSMLKKMNRYYDIEKLLEQIERIKHKFQNIKISTHIIYWFPWESKKDFLMIFRATQYFDQVQFFEMWYNEYLRENVPDYIENPKEIETKKKILINYYKSKTNFYTHFDNRIVVIKNDFYINKNSINSHTF